MNRNFYDFTFFKWILYCRAKTRPIRIDSESRKPSWRQRTPREPRQRRKSERSVGEPRRKGSSKRRIPRSSASGRRRNNADWRRSAPLGWSNSKWKLYDRLRPSRLASAMRRILESCEFIVIIEIIERTYFTKIHVGKILLRPNYPSGKEPNLYPSSDSLTYIYIRPRHSRAMLSNLSKKVQTTVRTRISCDL